MFSRCGQFLLLLTVIVTVAACPLWTQSATAAEPHSVSGSDLDRLVQGKRYPELEQQLQLAHLNPIDLAYFTGIVADRNNHPLDAIVDLEKVLPELRKTSPTHTAVALRTLAGDYFKTGRYGEASDTYSDVLKHFAAVFSAAEMQEMTDNRNMFELLRGAAPQTVSGEHEFRTPIRSNVLGNVEVPIQIGNATEWWILDTGANESSITVSTAKRIGLALSKESASGQSGATGKEVPLRTAVIPKLAIGGIVVRNVIVVVSEDKAFNVNLGKHGHYQIQGILGYPVLAAMGSLTILGNELQVQPESQPSPRSSRLYLEELTPLLEATVDGHDLLFGLDTGSDAASFTAKYLQEFPRQFASLKPKKWGVGGIGGIRWMHAYTLPEADLHLGTATATLKNVPVVTEDVGVDPLDGVFGNLGQSLLHQFRSYTIDFSQMRFTAGENATN
jgi:predicted aspartyl protease